VSPTIRAGNSNSFVEVSEEAFDTDGFVVSTGSRVETDAEESASVCEDATKSTAGIDDDKATHANFQENLLKHKASKFMCMYVSDGYTDDELSEVTHGR
jgi:hypothetical protein